MIDEEEKVEGMLIDYVKATKSVCTIDRLSKEECEKWKNKIRDAIEYLYQKQLVWRDAKADNVFI